MAPKVKRKPSEVVKHLWIQEKLLAGDSFLKLAHDYDLEVQQHPQYPHLLWFNIGGGDPTERLTAQCRGLILDSADQWRVISRPFDHIPEWSAPDAPRFDTWDRTTKVIDKVDGYAINMYCYQGTWHISSQRNIDASDTPLRLPQTLGYLFWKAFHDVTGQLTPPQAFQTCTFMFQLTGPLLTPVAIRRSNTGNQVTLLGIRQNATGEEMDPAHFGEQGIRPYCEAYEDTAGYTSFKEVLDSVVSTGLSLGEGYIVVDKNWRRVAVTHPEYDTAREFRAQLNQTWLINNIRSRKPDSRLFTYAQDWVPLHLMLARGYGDLVKRVFKAWQEHDKTASTAEYLKDTHQYPFRDILLKLRFKEVAQVTDALREVDPDELIGWLEVPAADEEKVA